MTDFDFDELDKAVNTVLGGPDTPVDQAASPAPTPEPQISRYEAPQAATPAPRPQSAPAVRRSGGRFMDVVHPSSDMRTRNETPAEAPASPVNAPAIVNQPPAKPDTSAGDLLDDFDWNTPLDSPFLPDTQVEKRPLGGSVPTGDSLRAALENDTQLLIEEPDEPRLETSVETPAVEEHTMPDPIDFAAGASVIEEVAEEKIEEPISVEIPAVVEAVAVSADPVSSELASDDDLSQAAALDAESHFVPGAEEVASSTIGDVPAAEQNTGPVSITQQYKEKPAEAAVSGAIYDTENYHQPITAPVKKKSGAWVILWIFLILIVGGGGGAAFYFFVLPSL